MRYYDPKIVREAIEGILSERWQPHPNLPEQTRADALLSLFSSMTETVYGAGRLSVQQPIIEALSLRHLLGVDARGWPREVD